MKDDKNKKLFRVTIQHTTYVLAEDESDAIWIAETEALSDEEKNSFASEVKPGEDITKSGWDDQSLVWGASKDTYLKDVWPKKVEP